MNLTKQFVGVRGVVSNISGSVYPLPQSYLDKAELTQDRCAKQLQAPGSERFAPRARRPATHPAGDTDHTRYAARQKTASASQLQEFIQKFIQDFDFPPAR